MFPSKFKNVRLISKKDEIIDKMTAEEGALYSAFLKKHFTKCYIKSEEKIRSTLDMLRTCELDIVFMQEVDEDIVRAIEEKLPQYRISKTEGKQCTSIILINEKAFKGLELKSLRC